MTNSERIFFYAGLKEPEAQEAILGDGKNLGAGKDATLKGYKRLDPNSECSPLVADTESEIRGKVFAFDDREVKARFDEVENAIDYFRTKLELTDGTFAWVYMKHPNK